jgi:formylglycine-generating enzyme required for sulfatase activity
LEEALPLFSQVALALDYAHSRETPVLHRDIKPSNIMVGEKGEVKVLDFGIACEIRETMTRFTGRASPGTLLYMSPEQVKGQKLGPATDLYSLAVTLYESLCGEQPFVAGSIEYQIIHELPRSIIERGVTISQSVENALLSGLSKEASSRPKTCGGFVQLLQSEVKIPVDMNQSESVNNETAKKNVDSLRSVRPHVPAVHVATPVTTEITNSIGMKLVLIAKGTFLMGSPVSEKKRDQDEELHQVSISKDFFLGTFLVTQAQYEKVMGKNPSYFQGDKVKGDSSNHPVEQVSWEDAVEFCKKLSELPEEKKAGRVYRLPTEAEWEYACRAGSKAAYSRGANSKSLRDYAWFWVEGGNQTHPVGEKKANAWGLYDMHGNVWEWCSDWYGEYPKGAVSDPTGPKEGSARVDRGGGFRNEAADCRSAIRGRYDPSEGTLEDGFRVALSSSGIPQSPEGR